MFLAKVPKEEAGVIASSAVKAVRRNALTGAALNKIVGEAAVEGFVVQGGAAFTAKKYAIKAGKAMVKPAIKRAAKEILYVSGAKKKEKAPTSIDTAVQKVKDVLADMFPICKDPLEKFIP